MHAAAFFQWRLLKSEKESKTIEEDTQKRIDYIKLVANDLQKSFYMQHDTIE